MINFHVDPYIPSIVTYSSAIQKHNLTKYLLFLSDEAEAKVEKLLSKLHVCT